MAKTTEEVFISYSHDSQEHKEYVRNLADKLRNAPYGIDIIGDFYDEDIPHGGQFPDLMEKIRTSKKVICVLTPPYKTRADEGRNGVGYEKVVITDELYKEISSSKFIPIIPYTEVNFEECVPNFLTSTRRAILRTAYKTEEDFIEGIARAVYNLPKNPKPPLGNNKLLEKKTKISDASEISIANIIKDSNHEIIFKNALFYAKNNDENNFRILSKNVKSYVFSNLLNLKEKTSVSIEINQTERLPDIMDKFINLAAPLFLIAFAGYLSFNDKFHSQEGLLIDLLTMEGWSNQSENSIIYNIPKLLAYVYHHIYGSLIVDSDRIDYLSKIFTQKIPSDQPRKYVPLYKVKSVTGWIDSLGKNFIKSFSYLLEGYQRWDWIKLLFTDEINFHKSLVCYQMTLNILDYFTKVKTNSLGVENSIYTQCDVPPSSMTVNNKIKEYGHHYLVKNSDFFKRFLKEHNISTDDSIEKWYLWLNEISKFNKFGDFNYVLFENEIMANILE